MAIDFPNSPSNNDEFTVGTTTWKYNGTAWVVVISQSEATIETGAVTTDKIAASAVTTAKIAAGAVTAAKLGNDISLTPADGSITQAKLASTLSGITICTSSTKPASPFTGQAIFETDTNRQRVWLGSAWSLGTQHQVVLPVEYLVIAGGGGGGETIGGGGGAGGYRTNVVGATSGAGSNAESTLNLTTGTYGVTIGAAGTGYDGTGYINGTNGADSVFGSITSIGGSGGGGYNIPPPTAGGSGGGAGAGSGSPSAGTAGQGYIGGAANANSNAGGGGGGAGAAGAANSGNTAGAGGAGLSSSINGTLTFRAGGGGGGGRSGVGTHAAGGTGGGGSGSTTGVGVAGTANTGGGGGGGGYVGELAGGNGGSGIVIVRYLTSAATSYSITGGTATTDGSYTVRTFLASGSLVIV